MQHTKARVAASLAFGAALLAAAPAHADNGLNDEQLPPDILLLVDTSGSMAYSSIRDPANPSRYALPKCSNWPSTTGVDFNATTFGALTPPDRWAMLVKVLTGTVHGIRCSAESRSSNDFSREFALGGTSFGGGQAPYDANYYLPFNRIVASDGTNYCTPAPSWDSGIRQQLIDNAILWPSSSTASPIYWRTVGDYASSQPCPFDPQEPDGLVDSYRETVRFGLMTFDPHPNWTDGSVIKAGTGMMIGSYGAYYPSGIGDTWSYFPSWMTDSSFTSAAEGWPGGCDSTTGQSTKLLEVGARNPAAPPWEGRLIGFGNPSAETNEIASNNDRVQLALAAMRPYGGTPVAGMMEDARHFLLNDSTVLEDNAHKGYFWGGAADPSTQGADACRQRHVVLLTDGGPNLDLRPECDITVNAKPGQCPYRSPADTAEILANNDIKVHVIGFSVSASGSGSTKTCTELTASPTACDALTSCTDTACATGKCAYGYCVDTSSSDQELLATCCTIKGIAAKGGGNAYFAEDTGTLFAAFTSILTDVVGPPASRTQTVFAPGSAQYKGPNTGEFASAQFRSGFHVACDPEPCVDPVTDKTKVGDLLVGDLDRVRTECKVTGVNGPLEPVDVDTDDQEGDQFADNLAATKTTRRFYTVVGEVDSAGKIWSGRSIRPHYTVSTGGGDNLGSFGISAGDSVTKMVTSLASSFPAQVDARAVLDSASCNGGKCCFSLTSDISTCRTWYLNLEMGLPAGSTDITFQRASPFGAIERTTPLLSVPPTAFLRDDSYVAFQKLFKARKPILYATTSDGQLHAFDILKLDTTLNELWSFIPPAILPAMTAQFQNRYTAAPLRLLDGALVTRDVAGTVTMPADGRFLTRTKTQAKNLVSTTRWYSVLVGSYGSRSGFYAMDVSWPDPATAPPLSGYSQGPRFLWQLTTDGSGAPIFGDRGAAPAIATLYFSMPGDAAAEHAVAILPGGYSGEASKTDSDAIQFTVDGYHDSRFGLRQSTRRYTPTDPTAVTSVQALGGARSITLVRLDTGEVIRTFRHGAPGVSPVNTEHEAPAGLYTANRITNVGFDAPIVGQIVSYPSSPGSVADRAYFGDAEGRLWKLDLSAKNPAEWKAIMVLDAYPTSGMNNAYTWADGAPIQTPPIVSTDTTGRVTVAVSTGDQTMFSRQGKHPIWSMTETLSSGKPVTRVNWFLNENNAVAGEGANQTPHLANGERVTGPMALFDGVLHFTTYDPSASSVLMCKSGNTYLWAVHYINAGVKGDSAPSSSTSPDVGPIPYLDLNPPPDDLSAYTPSESKDYVRFKLLAQQAVAFGVGIRQRPSCYTTEDVPADPFLGYGTHSSITSATAGRFQLVVQSGKEGTATGDSKVKVSTQNLTSPAGGAQIDSWASIVE